MGADTLVRLSVAFILLGLLILGLSEVAYFFGLMIGGINSLFFMFQYIGASCSLITGITYSFYISFLVIFIVSIWGKLND